MSKDDAEIYAAQIAQSMWRVVKRRAGLLVTGEQISPFAVSELAKSGANHPISSGQAIATGSDGHRGTQPQDWQLGSDRSAKSGDRTPSTLEEFVQALTKELIEADPHESGPSKQKERKTSD